MQGSGRPNPDAALSALRRFADAVVRSEQWEPIYQWAVDGGSTLHLPESLTGLPSYEEVRTAVGNDEIVRPFADDAINDRPILRIGVLAHQLSEQTLPAGMLAAAIIEHTLGCEYTVMPPTATELGERLATNLSRLRKILSEKAVKLPILAGVRGIRLGPGQTSLATPLGTLRATSRGGWPPLAEGAHPDSLVIADVSARFQHYTPHTEWRWSDEAGQAVKAHLRLLRLSFLLASSNDGQDIDDWLRPTVTGYMWLLPYLGLHGWVITPPYGDVAGRDITTAEAEAARALSDDLRKDKRVGTIDLAIERVLNAATERHSATDALVDAVVALDALFGAPGETRLRVSAAVAWLLEPAAKAAREELFQKLLDLYDARSHVVHGNAKKRREGEALAADAIRTVLRVLKATLGPESWLLDIGESHRRGYALMLGGPRSVQ